MTSPAVERSPKVYYHLSVYDPEGKEDCDSQVREETENYDTSVFSSGVGFTRSFMHTSQVF
jgi:hypothetical protein